MNESTKNNSVRAQKKESPHGLGLSRRTFLKTTGAAAAGISLGVALSSSAKPLPMAKKTGIQHIVLVMMENRSFDHFLGWLPGAAGQQAGLSCVARNENRRLLFPPFGQG